MSARATRTFTIEDDSMTLDIKALWDKRNWNGHVAAYQPWVFSISALAWQPDVLVRKKVFHDVPFETGWYFRIGTAIHEFIQHRLGPDWDTEQEIWMDIPYAFQAVKSDKITLYGSLDAINFQEHVIHEYKTTSSANAGVKDDYLIQAAGYAHMCREMYHSDFETHIIVIPLHNDADVIDHVMTAEEHDKCWNELLGRAEYVAKQIDQLFMKENEADKSKKECIR